MSQARHAARARRSACHCLSTCPPADRNSLPVTNCCRRCSPGEKEFGEATPKARREPVVRRSRHPAIARKWRSRALQPQVRAAAHTTAAGVAQRVRRNARCSDARYPCTSAVRAAWPRARLRIRCGRAVVARQYAPCLATESRRAGREACTRLSRCSITGPIARACAGSPSDSASNRIAARRYGRRRVPPRYP